MLLTRELSEIFLFRLIFCKNLSSCITDCGLKRQVGKILAKLKFGSKTYNLPSSPSIRILIGILLILGGILGFLPVLGFWMIPLGIIVLSVDIGYIRRLRRKIVVRYGRKKKKNTDVDPELDSELNENSENQN